MDILFSFVSTIPWWAYIIVALLVIAVRDVFFNKRHTIKHNFPIVGHIRYLLERIGPELRQYIVANNREELPFNRSQRSWVYASSKQENNYEGFGTDKDIHQPGFIFINPAMMPYPLPEGHPNRENPSFIPCAKIMGAYHKRKRPYRPKSIVNISAMSFGSLSSNAIMALNKGAHQAGCYHNTGEGSLSPYHTHGADVVFHFGTAYFGVRDQEGRFEIDKMVDIVNKNPFVRAIEIKLSQGAKPGKGGVLPASKITKEISEIRGIPMGKDVLSPPYHSAFNDVPSLLAFIEDTAEKTGLPVGIKSAIGKLEMWEELTDLMVKTGKGPDFITVDGGEGGTGAAPPSFADHVSLPFVYGFAEIYKLFEKKGLVERVVFIGSGKLGFPAHALMAMAMGCDLINVAREALMSIGCIQAQVCHNNSCPTGIATQKAWLKAGLNPDLKAVRFANYIKTLNKEILEITHACGYEHPCQMKMGDVDISMGDNNYTKPIKDTYGYNKVPVPFIDMQHLKDCIHLGGSSKSHPKRQKKDPIEI